MMEFWNREGISKGGKEAFFNTWSWKNDYLMTKDEVGFLHLM